jgi:hypothetical protein
MTNKVVEMEYKTQDVLAVAYAAYRQNNGYVKDTYRFSEPENHTLFSNKDLLKFQFRPDYRPDDFRPIKTLEEDYQSVDDALKHFRRYTMSVLGDDLSDFQRDIVEAVWLETVPFNKLGILAYVPEFVSRETKDVALKKTIRTEYRESNAIGEKGEPVEGVCKILSSSYSNHYERYHYTADYMGNLVSFWCKFEVPVGEHRKFKAKVKDHTKNKLFEVNETALNYVRIYKV